MSISFSAAAYQELQTKLAALLEERKALMQRLIQAREQGDLSENGAYKYAKIGLGDVGRELRRIRQLLADGVVIAKSSNTEVVDFLSTVTVEMGGKRTTYTMVSLHESDIQKNKLSLESPIGMALKGKRVGDIVQFSTPRGEQTIQIIAIA